MTSVVAGAPAGARYVMLCGEIPMMSVPGDPTLHHTDEFFKRPSEQVQSELQASKPARIVGFRCPQFVDAMSRISRAIWPMY